MARVSPTAEGFRAAFRRPSFALAEITWRWVVGITSVVLMLFGFSEYLSTLPVNRGEMLLLDSGQPFLVAQAILHILRGGLARAVFSLTVAALLLALLWIITASLGRTVTLSALLDYVREKLAAKAAELGIGREQENTTAEEMSPRGAIGPLLRLNFLRASLALATIVAFMGAAILASFVSSRSNPSPGLAFLLFFPLAVLVTVAWFGLNWLLSLAAVFVVRDGEDAAGAIAAAVSLSRERPGAVLAVSTWTALSHLVAFVAASTVISMVLGFAPLLPWRLVVLLVLVLSLAYFAVADWIYTARLSGYVTIVEMPEEFWAPVMPPATPPPPAPPLQTTIDRDEPILSDLPNLAMET